MAFVVCVLFRRLILARQLQDRKIAIYMMFDRLLPSNTTPVALFNVIDTHASDTCFETCGHSASAPPPPLPPFSQINILNKSDPKSPSK